MANILEWENLTPTEKETLDALKKDGKKIYAAPIEIEHADQLKALGFTWAECRTWYIGSEKVTVHLTPADEQTYRFLINVLRSRHRDDYRAKRCMIPGKLKPLIRCPEHHCCHECPFPQYRDQHMANQVSLEVVIDSGYEKGDNNRMVEQLEAALQYSEIRSLMIKANPLIAQVFELKECDGFTTEEIANMLNLSKRQVYYFYSKALAIGKQYNEN